jgi:hypothetical protein
MRAIGAWVLAAVLGLALTEAAVRGLELFAPARQLVSRGDAVVEQEEAPAARALMHPFRGWQMRAGRVLPAEELLEGAAPVGTEPRPGGRRVHNRFGFRSSFEDYRDLDPADFVVGVAGGSLASMLVVRAGRELEQSLAALLGLPVERVHVLNLASGGYKQPQQLAILAEMLLLDVPLDAVVNLDGFNEVVFGQLDAAAGKHPYFPSRYHITTVLELARAAPSPKRIQRWAELLGARESAAGWLRWGRDSRPARLLESARALAGALAQRDLDRARRLEAALAEGPDDADAGTVSAELDDPCLHEAGSCLALIVDLWQRSSLAMAQLCEGAGIAYLHALQPNQYVPGTKPLNAEEREKAFAPDHAWARAAARGYPLLIERGSELAQRGVAWADLTDVFAGVEQTLYIDDCCHVNADGSRRIVAALVERLRPLLAPRAARSSADERSVARAPSRAPEGD